ncbi:MAG: ABC transporter ATP-binding protein [Clostridia bacterium]|nr:ABC transporter ATP-binding protein [Clostridia bacterium]
MLGEISMDLIQPDMMGKIVDEGVLVGNLPLILDVGVKMVLLVLFGVVCGILSGVFANLAAQQFGNDLRKDVFKRIMNLSFQNTDKISTGSLVTRLTNDVTQVQMMVMMSVRSVVISSVMFLGGIFMLYRQAPKFAFIAACALPFLVFFVTFFMKKASPMFSVVQKKLDRINNIMQENVAGARVVKAFVQEKRELDKFDSANEDLCNTNLRVQTLLAFMNPLMNIVLNICIVCIIAIGGVSFKGGAEMSPGSIMAAITYMALILHGLTFMANIFQTFTRARASIHRINEVLSCKDVINDGIGEETDKTGEVEFRNVSFAYPDAPQSLVLDNVSFSLRKGETLAIIGATGSGKSSLVNLIPRFYDVTCGEVLLNGVNVKEYKLKELRDKIAIVMQKAELYSRSIEANIRWGKDDATPWQIKDAATVAQADDFICRTANGYYTLVSEGGHSLSGGQKQRLSISRAIIKNAEILIFDDSTSALDLKTEAKLYSAMKKSFDDTSKIIIAQRIASVKDADRIIVLEGGRISAMGSHEELLLSSDVYKEIYNSQLKGGALDE